MSEDQESRLYVVAGPANAPVKLVGPLPNVVQELASSREPKGGPEKQRWSAARQFLKIAKQLGEGGLEWAPSTYRLEFAPVEAGCDPESGILNGAFPRNCTGIDSTTVGKPIAIEHSRFRNDPTRLRWFAFVRKDDQDVILSRGECRIDAAVPEAKLEELVRSDYRKSDPWLCLASCYPSVHCSLFPGELVGGQLRLQEQNVAGLEVGMLIIDGSPNDRHLLAPAKSIAWIGTTESGIEYSTDRRAAFIPELRTHLDAGATVAILDDARSFSTVFENERYPKALPGEVPNDGGHHNIDSGLQRLGWVGPPELNNPDVTYVRHPYPWAAAELALWTVINAHTSFGGKNKSVLAKAGSAEKCSEDLAAAKAAMKSGLLKPWGQEHLKPGDQLETYQGWQTVAATDERGVLQLPSGRRASYSMIDAMIPAATPHAQPVTQPEYPSRAICEWLGLEYLAEPAAAPDLFAISEPAEAAALIESPSSKGEAEGLESSRTKSTEPPVEPSKPPDVPVWHRAKRSDYGFGMGGGLI